MDNPSPRVPLKLEVEFRRSYGRQPWAGVLRNLSLTGAFLQQSNGLFLPGEKLELHLDFGGRRRRLVAEVIWGNPLGYGIRFQPASKRDSQIVDDIIDLVESRRRSRRQLLDSIFKEAA